MSIGYLLQDDELPTSWAVCTTTAPRCGSAADAQHVDGQARPTSCTQLAHTNSHLPPDRSPTYASARLTARSGGWLTGYFGNTLHGPKRPPPGADTDMACYCIFLSQRETVAWFTPSSAAMTCCFVPSVAIRWALRRMNSFFWPLRLPPSAPRSFRLSR